MRKIFKEFVFLPARLIVSIILLILSCTIVKGQSGWTYQQVSPNITLNNIDFISSLTGWVSGGLVNLNGQPHNIFHTTNGGVSWALQTIENIDSTEYCLIDFVDANTGWASFRGEFPAPAVTRVYKTTNSGQNWNLLTTISDQSNVTYLKFIDQNTGFLKSNFLYKTSNGGENWTQIGTPPGITYDMYFIDDQVMWHSGVINPPSFFTGIISKSTNGGLNWVNQLQLNDIRFFSLNFIDLNSGFAGGDSTERSSFTTVKKIVAKTTNSGINWIKVETGLPNGDAVKNIYFTDQSIGWMTDAFSIFITSNAGMTWNSQAYNPANTNLSAMNFWNGSTGWITGASGTILRTTDGGGSIIGINTNSNDIPSSYNLNQNYPNPFNPTTRIKFDIPKGSLVKLRVYDILGREVAELVNEKLNAGAYEYEWNGAGLTSGVYFYRLYAGEFTETKRMVLVK